MKDKSQRPPEKKRDRKKFWMRILIFLGGIIVGAIILVGLMAWGLFYILFDLL